MRLGEKMWYQTNRRICPQKNCSTQALTAGGSFQRHRRTDVRGGKTQKDPHVVSIEIKKMEMHAFFYPQNIKPIHRRGKSWGENLTRSPCIFVTLDKCANRMTRILLQHFFRIDETLRSILNLKRTIIPIYAEEFRKLREESSQKTANCITLPHSPSPPPSHKFAQARMACPGHGPISNMAHLGPWKKTPNILTG